MSSLIVSLLLAALAAGAQQSSTQVIGRVVDAQTNEPLAGAEVVFLPGDICRHARCRRAGRSDQADQWQRRLQS